MKTLRLNARAVEQKLIRFIRQQMQQAHFSKVVLGISGGVDSALALHLCCRALGSENVFGLILPYKTTPQKSITYARLLARKYGVKTKLVDITPQIDAYFSRFSDADRIRRGNKMARERMSILYDHSQAWRALVVGTGNRSESLLGYGTIYGDMACAFNPLGGLYKTQVRQLAKSAGIPKVIITQAPTAGLWPGQTDEGELGMTYAQVDKLLFALIDRRVSEKKLRRQFSPAFIQRVKTLIAANKFKTRLPPIAQL
ncbi:MAG: NAD+ synthase [Candidatus Omnitrophota bacterium]